MRVRFQAIVSPCYVQVRTPEGERTEEIWPVLVELEVNGTAAPLHFAWDRHHHVLYVDERWKGRELLGDAAAAQRAAAVAREVLRKATDQALGS